MPVLGFERDPVAGKDSIEVVANLVGRVLGLDVPNSHPGEFLPRVAEALVGRFVELDELPGRAVDEGDGVPRLADDAREDFFTLPERVFGRPPVGYVEARARDTGRASIPATHRPGRTNAANGHSPSSANDAELEFRLAAARHQAVEPLLRVRHVVRMEVAPEEVPTYGGGPSRKAPEIRVLGRECALVPLEVEVERPDLSDAQGLALCSFAL